MDGLMDIFVANDKTYNSLFHNKGGGRFEEVAFETGVAVTENGELISGMGVDFRDIDNDGIPDIAIVALDDETFPLFKGLGLRGFSDITRASRMGALSLPMAGYSPRSLTSTTTAGKTSSSPVAMSSLSMPRRESR